MFPTDASGSYVGARDSDAAVVLIINGGKFLIIRRKLRDGDPWSGDMALPGGYRKSRETSAEAASRESEEEVGIRPEGLRYLGTYTSLKSLVTVNAYLSTLPDCPEPVAGPEVSEAFWASFDNLERGEACFNLGNYRIWGLTYRILSDYLRA